MKTVQLAIHDSDYAQLLRNLLLRDGMHRVYLVEQPDLRMEGVVVIDENQFQNLSLLDSEPERFVVVTRKGTDHLSKVWDAGIRHVVFEEDPANTAQLAIIAAELRLPRGATGAVKPPKTPDPPAEKHRSMTPPSLPAVGLPERFRRSGLKNA